MKNRTNVLACLKQRVAEVEGGSVPFSGQSFADDLPGILGLGNIAINTHLGGGLSLDALHEVRCSASRDIATASWFVCQLLMQQDETKPVVWILDPATSVEDGSLYPDGLHQLGIKASRFIFVKPTSLKDAIWTAGETVKTGEISAVIFQIKGNPKIFDLSVSRKLMLRAQQSNTPFFVLRQAGEEEASSATTRWHVEPRPSLPDQTFHQGIGDMRLSLTLERNRNSPSGKWLVAWNPRTRSLENAAENTEPTHSGLPLLTPANRPDCTPEMEQVMAFGKAS